MINEQKHRWKIEKNKGTFKLWNPQNIELLRFTTAGSVDDGKSTL